MTNPKVTIPMSQAFAAGHTEYGDQPVSDFKAVLADLDESVRSRLEVKDGRLQVVSVSGLGFFVYSASPETFDVVCGIMQAYDEAMNKDLSELEKLRSNPSIAFDSFGMKRFNSWSVKRVARLCSVCEVDASVVESELSAAHSEMLAAWRSKAFETLSGDCHQHELKEIREVAEKVGSADLVDLVDEKWALIKAECAERERASAVSREAFLAWALEHGSVDLRYAIDHDYPFRKQIEKEVAACFFPDIVGLGRIECQSDSGDRTLPDARARKCLADLEEAIADRLSKGGLPVNITSDVVRVSRIRSVSYYAPCDCVDGECSRCDSDGEVLVDGTGFFVFVELPHVLLKQCYVVVERPYKEFFDRLFDKGE